MVAKISHLAMLPGYHPYPRYGRVVKEMDDGSILLTQVQCGDPRCASEHVHGDVVWRAADSLSAHAYQARADWEEGRTSSPNAVIVEDEQ